ncbi:MAG: dihydroorotase [Verrucomicrobiota bacterium]
MSHKKRIIKADRILDPASRRDESGVLYISGGKLVAPFEEAQADEVLEFGKDCWVCPGLIDSMAMLCEPGMSARETIETGTQAAAAGGFTSLINMPGNQPPTDEVHRLIWIQQRIAEKALVNVFPTATISKGMEGELLAPIGSLHRAGAVALTDHSRCLQNNELMRRALEYASMFDVPILDHCRDASLSAGGVMNEGYWSTILGLRGWPSIAEEAMVSRNALLAELTGARVHCLQVTSKGSIRIIREAKERGVPVTAGTTVNHLMLDDENLKGYDSIFKVSPPLRSWADVEVLRKAVQEGVVDFIVSDHTPYREFEKEVEFDDAPFGAPGLETALGGSLTALVHEAGMQPLDFVSLWTNQPAAYFKLDRGTLSEGAPADITVIDPEMSWEVDPEAFCSKSKISPFAGRALKGKAICTIVGGETVWQDEK